MKIVWHGYSCFEITSSSPEGKVRLVTDPFKKNTGLNLPRKLEAEVVTVSHKADDANNVKGVDGDPFVVEHAGEYEVGALFVYGINAPTAETEDEKSMSNMIVRIESEGVEIAHLGAINRELTDEELEKLKTVDILMLPVGGGRVLDPETATDVISQVEPRVVIPMTHGIEKVKEELATVDDFCNALGSCRQETSSTYTVSRSKLPEEDMLVMVLTRFNA